MSPQGPAIAAQAPRPSGNRRRALRAGPPDSLPTVGIELASSIDSHTYSLLDSNRDNNTGNQPRPPKHSSTTPTHRVTPDPAIR